MMTTDNRPEEPQLTIADLASQIAELRTAISHLESRIVELGKPTAFLRVDELQNRRYF